GFATTDQTDYQLDTDTTTAAIHASESFAYTDFATKKVIQEKGPLPAGWHLDGLTCKTTGTNTDATNLEFSSTGDVNTPADWHATFTAGDSYARFDVAAGSDVTCTFHNTQEASLTVAKQTAPATASATTFPFTTTGQTDYSLDTDPATAGTHASETFKY